MNIIKSIFMWVKSIVLWLVISENRKVGIKYTKKALDIAEVVSKFTSSTKDDKAVAFLAKQFNKAAQLNNITEEESLKKVANEVSKISKGSLKDISVGIDNGKIGLSFGKGGVKYNPKDGSVKFGITL